MTGLTMKHYASTIGSFITDTSIMLGASPMRTLALTGYGLTLASKYTLQASQKLGF